MLPLKIIIKNFLSYGEIPQEIDFQGHKFVCLSGANGNGKSALLESIFWTLWGFARKNQGISKNDELVMHTGSDEMFVELFFAINNKKYLVKRSCKKKNKKLITDLQFFYQEELEFKNLTSSHQKETQDLINKIVGVNYETFINTAFLRQGMSNEFSKKTPKERKDLLGKILGIEKIQELREKILEDIRIKAEQINVLNQTKQNIFIKYSKSDLEKIKEDLFYNKKIFLEKKEELKKKKENLSNVEKKINEFNSKNSQIINEDKNLNLLIEQKKSLIKETISDYKKQKNIIYKINLLKIKFKDLDTNINFTDLQNLIDLTKNEIKILDISIETNRTESNIKTKKLFEDSYKKKTHLQNEISNLKSKKFEINENIKLLEDENKKHAIEIESFKNKFDYVEKFLNEIKSHTKKIKQLEKLKIIFFYKKKKSLNKINILELISNEEKKECIICKNYFDINKNEIFKKNIKESIILIKNYKDKTERKINLIKDKISIYTKLIDYKNKNLKEISQDIINKDKRNIKTSENNNKIFKLKNEIIEHEKNLFEKENLIKKIDNLFEKENNIISENFKKIEIEFNIKKNNLTQRLSCLNEIKDQYKILTEFELKDKNKDFKNIITKTFEEIKEIKNKIKNIYEKISILLLEKKTNEIIIKNIKNEIEENEKTLNEFYETLTQEYAIYTTNEDDTNSKIKKITDLEKEINELNEYYKIRSKLAYILDKDSLQAAIIEDSIPELEQEANNILNVLTNGRSSIFIESIKDLKSGNPKETLDIMISDHTGIRHYEFFSGGESFRIDLSLRIALAKILAKRSGTPIKTFIIDEGFGSQDEVSLELVIKTIYKLQYEFDLIILVSHLPFVKDEFSTNFIVNKNSFGSVISII
jgi:exonuclease SbcC